MTPDHRILLKKPFRKGYPIQVTHWDSYWNHITARTLPRVVKAKGFLKLPLAGKYRQGKLSIGDYYSELLGWILMDGNFLPKCRAVEITQSSVNSKKVVRIRFILEMLNIKFIERKRKYYSATTKQMEIMHRFYLNASDFTDRIRRDIPDKKPTWELLQLIPSELAAKKAPSLLTGILGGDSALYAKKRKKKDGSLLNSCMFTQKDPSTRIWIQALCSLVGCRSKERPDKVAICGRDTIEISNRKGRKPHISIKRTRTPIKVWGVKIPNQFVVCRRTVLEENIKGEKVKKSYVFITSGGVPN